MDRANFADKYLFEELYHYTRDFINGLNIFFKHLGRLFGLLGLENENFIRGYPNGAKSQEVYNWDKILDGSVEVKKLNEINCLIATAFSINERNCGNLSTKILKPFTCYDENNFRSRNSNCIK